MSDNVVPMQKQTRLNVNINQQTADAIRRYCANHDVTATEAVRRFVGVADHIMREVDGGNDILIRNGRGQTERIVFTY